jgi:hypothetical protein
MIMRPKFQWSIAILIAVAAAYVALTPGDRHLSGNVLPGATEQHSDITRLFRERQSGVVVEGVGSVEKLLPDDLDGSRHQRFILRLAPGSTLLVSHNIDLAPRIESLRVGDEVRFRGQYEWNERGGVVHWTHHDPAGERPGGWLRHASRTYQ